MLGIVIPAHDEAAHIGECVASARAPRIHHQLLGEEVRVIVVLDSCTDDTEAIARALGADVTHIDARNVGMARAHGAERALALGRALARVHRRRYHRRRRLARAAARLLRRRGVRRGRRARLVAACRRGARAFRRAPTPMPTAIGTFTARTSGVSAHAYLRAGGFRAAGVDEDVALVEALLATGAHDRMERGAARGDERADGFPREERLRSDAGGREQALFTPGEGGPAVGLAA